MEADLPRKLYWGKYTKNPWQNATSSVCSYLYIEKKNHHFLNNDIKDWNTQIFKKSVSQRKKFKIAIGRDPISKAEWK